MITPGRAPLVRRHVDADDLCAIVYGDNSFVTGADPREFGVRHLIATEPETRAGRFHRPRRRHAVLSEGKVRRVDEWLAGAGTSSRRSRERVSTATRTMTCRAPARDAPGAVDPDAAWPRRPAGAAGR